MEDRTFELLEKLYLDMQDMKTEMKEMKEAMVVKDDLKNFATKDDLKNFATKDDLKNFATKDDLKNFATKDDLKNFATKDDLKKLATKDDLELISKQLHMEIQTVYEEVQGLRNDLNTMEMVTAKNSYDIAILKAVRQ